MSAKHRRGSSLAALLDLVTGGSSAEESRKWAVDIAAETSKFRELEHIEDGMRETTTKLKIAREKVAELQTELKMAKEAKYDKDMDLIQQLRSQQASLLSTIVQARNQKKELIRLSSVEMDRLRSIIRCLHEIIDCLECGLDLRNVSPETIANYMMYNSSMDMLKRIGLPSLIERATNPEMDAAIMQQTFERKGKIRAMNTFSKTFSRARATDASGAEDSFDIDALVSDSDEVSSGVAGGSAGGSGGISGGRDEEDDFPICDESCIDFRTVTAGDGITYANPTGRLEFAYLAYIHDESTGTCTLLDLPSADTAALAYSSAFDTSRMRRPSIWECFTDVNEDDGPTKTHITQLGASENVTGLEQALLQMTEGEQAKVWIPGRLGYGRRGVGKLIPPNANLIFMLHLIRVLPDADMLSAEPPDPEDDDLLDQSGAYGDDYFEGASDESSVEITALGGVPGFAGVTEQSAEPDLDGPTVPKQLSSSVAMPLEEL